MNINHESKQSRFWTELLKRNGYPQTMLIDVTKKILRMPEDLQEAIKMWDKTGVLPDLEAEGFTVVDLVNQMGLNSVAAFLMIDWLRRDPNEAKIALSQPISKMAVNAQTIFEMEHAEKIDQNEHDQEQID